MLAPGYPYGIFPANFCTSACAVEIHMDMCRAFGILSGLSWGLKTAKEEFASMHGSFRVFKFREHLYFEEVTTWLVSVL